MVEVWIPIELFEDQLDFDYRSTHKKRAAIFLVQHGSLFIC